MKLIFSINYMFLLCISVRTINDKSWSIISNYYGPKFSDLDFKNLIKGKRPFGLERYCVEEFISKLKFKKL